MHFNDYPFLRYALCFILGILAYPVVASLDHGWFGGLFLLLFGAYYLALSRTVFLPRFRGRLTLSALGYASWIGFGLMMASLADPFKNEGHLLYLEEVQAYVGVASEVDEPKAKSLRNLLQVQQVQVGEAWIPTTGKVILYHQKSLQPGQVVLVKGQPQRVVPPVNPGEFDYARFLARQGVFHTHFVGQKAEVVGEIDTWSLSHYFMQLRHHLEQVIDQNLTDNHSRQIAKALLLGQKNTLDKEVSQAYSTAGAMHVLAVSGLHVGIIYGFFFLLIRPGNLRTRWRVIYLTLVIGVIWMYAFLTGMSPSVLRSATMFTMVALAQMQSKSPSTFNAVAVSAVLLLLFDPNLVYAVGFQLSYAALLGILVFQPIIVKAWLPRNRILYRAWEITSVGLAAQLATFPISAYYFHQFPTFFMISNLIAIPGAFLIMALGIPFLLLSEVGILAAGLGKVLNGLLMVFNHGIFAVQELPFAKVDRIHFSGLEIAWYYLLLMLLLSLYHFPGKRMAYAVMFVIVLGVAINWSGFLLQSDEVVVYALKKGKAVDYFRRGSVYSWQEGVPAEDVAYQVDPYRLAKGIKSKGVTISDSTVRLDWSRLPIEKAFRFENGRWRQVSPEAVEPHPQKAYKLVLKKEW